jgi:predicted outer membrane repeat protein
VKTIAANTTIDGGGKITLSGNSASRLFVVNSLQSLDLQNIVMEDGAGGGSNGGAIENDGFLGMENSTIKDSTAGAFAGALLSFGAADITNSTFLNNKASNGGAIVASGSNAQVTLAGSVLNGNQATGSGSDGQGGAVLELNGATVNVFSSQISGNSATNQGGAIAVPDSNSSLNLQGSTLLNNSSPTKGGGIYSNGMAYLKNDMLTGNKGVGEGLGGGIYNYGHLTLTNVTLNKNTAYYGGGLSNAFSTADLTNVTLTGNSVVAYGGGIDNLAATLDLTNVTMSGNSAGSGGGGIFNESVSTPHLNLTNVIVAKSPSGGNCKFDHAPDSATSNLSTDATCGFGAGRDNATILLGGLETNGGLTLTQRLLPGSLAIDDGTSNGAPSTDQRDLARPQGATFDVGAVEFVPCSGLPTKPALVSPKANSRVTVTKVPLDWAGPDCATSFKVRVRQGSTSGPVVFTATRFPSSQVTTSTLARGHSYRWHVTACDTSGCTTGPWWSFTVS